MQRLKTRPQFQAVLAGGTVSRTAHFALHRCTLTPSDASRREGPAPMFPEQVVWLGAMVPKRWAKRAVTRNTIKRQIYHVSAEVESMLDPQAYVVRLRSGFDRAQFISASSDMLKLAVRTELQQLFSRVCVPLASQVPSKQLMQGPA